MRIECSMADYHDICTLYADAEITGDYRSLMKYLRLHESENFNVDLAMLGVATEVIAAIASSPQQRAPHPPSVRESAGEGE